MSWYLKCLEMSGPSVSVIHKFYLILIEFCIFKFSWVLMYYIPPDTCLFFLSQQKSILNIYVNRIQDKYKFSMCTTLSTNM